MRSAEGGELEVEGLPYLKHVVLIDDEAASAPGITGYDEFLKGAERVSEDELKQRQESLHTDEVIKEQGRDHALVLRAGAVADGATPRGGWRLETTSPELLPVLAARRAVGRPVRVVLEHRREAQGQEVNTSVFRI